MENIDTTLIATIVIFVFGALVYAVLDYLKNKNTTSALKVMFANALSNTKAIDAIEAKYQRVTPDFIQELVSAFIAAGVIVAKSTETELDDLGMELADKLTDGKPNEPAADPEPVG